MDEPKRLYFDFTPSATWGEDWGYGDLYRRYNYEICSALDLTRLDTILKKMVDSGHLHPRLAELYHLQASALLAQLISENNRSFAEEKNVK